MPGQAIPMGALPFYLVALTMLLTGVSTMSLRDYMDVQHFHFPMHWVWLTMVGYMLALPMHRITKKSNQGRLPFVHQDAHEMPMKVYIGCMILDSFAMVAAYSAMGIISAAVVQMMRGTKLIITFFISTKIQHQPQDAKHYAGVGMTLLGLLIVASGSLHKNHDPHKGGSLEKGGGDGVVGALLLCLLSEIFMAGSYLYQDYVVKKYDAPTLQIVGMMGVTGTIFFTGLLAALNFANVESSPQAFEKVVKSFPLALAVLVYTLALPVYELAGLTVSKHGSAVIRALIDVTRGALIWSVELFYHWVDFEILHLIGFCTIAVGTLVYVGGVPGIMANVFSGDIPTADESAKLKGPETVVQKYHHEHKATSSAASAASTRAPSVGSGEESDS